MSTTSLLPDVGTELREGYAESGDKKTLHYVEAGEGPLVVLLHGFPVLVRLAATDPSRSWRRVLGGRPRHAGLQPVIEARGLRGLRRRPAGPRHPGLNERARRRVRVPGRSRLGRINRLDSRDEPPRGRRPARDPQRGPPAEAIGGTAPSEPAPEVLVLLLLRDTGTARGGGPRSETGTSSGTSWTSEPAVHAGGDGTLRGGVVAARGSPG